MSEAFPVITVPFEERHKCWFCGEPYTHFVAFPEETQDIAIFKHEPCQLPACQECLLITKRYKFHSVFTYRSNIKQVLTKRYAKDLQIGERWSEQELQDADFDGAAFLGFKKSAWLMHTIARQRVNFESWPVEINGVMADKEVNQVAFNFDGMAFVNINAAVDYYAEAYYLHKQLLHDVIMLLPPEKFSYAIRLCRLYPSFPSEHYADILDEIKLIITDCG